MSLASQVSALATRIAQEFNSVRSAIGTKANISHAHLISDLPVATSGASSAIQVVRADDSRLSNSRTPTAHTHVATTDLTATGTKNSTTFLRGDDTWAVPSVALTIPTQPTDPGTGDGSLWYDDDDNSSQVVQGAVYRVVHNGTSYPARPSGATYVDWVGPTDPGAAAANNDTWTPT